MLWCLPDFCTLTTAYRGEWCTPGICSYSPLHCHCQWCNQCDGSLIPFVMYCQSYVRMVLKCLHSKLCAHTSLDCKMCTSSGQCRHCGQ